MKKQSLSILSILGLIFVTLKLTGNIDWSWWLVTLPFYGVLAFAVLLWLVCVALQALFPRGLK